MPDVALVCMPFAQIQHPSAALGILTASLNAAGISNRVFYDNLRFAADIGLESYVALESAPVDVLLAEWVFAGAAFPDFAPDLGEYLTLLRTRVSPRLLAADHPEASLEACLCDLRLRAESFIAETADAILAHGPRIVACTSSFQQHCASLALLRAVHERAPEVITVLGGANCEGVMGRTTWTAFPWVDCVVSGEADLLFPDLCRRLLESGRAVAPADLPAAVLGPCRQPVPGGSGHEARPNNRAVVPHLDGCPVPDYDDYFQALADSPLADHVVPGLLMETSRGCWWGQHHACLFCGLNALGIQFRSKSPERVVAEIGHLTARHGVRRIEFTDNTLDLHHVSRTFAPLADADPPPAIFAETTAHLSRRDLDLLAAGGVRWIQAGLESLHDAILQALGKQTDALTNLQTLKWALERGIRVTWNILTNVPGEQDAWYAAMATRIPLLTHLQPPFSMPPLRYDRFSRLHARAADFGLHLVPRRGYAFVYPLSADLLDDMAYYFEEAESAANAAHGHGLDALATQLGLWIRRFWSPASDRARPRLDIVRASAHRLTILDTRTERRKHVLCDHEARIYRAIDAARTVAGVVDALAREEIPLPVSQVADVLDGFVATGLALQSGDRFLALAVTRPRPALPAVWDYPGGHVWTRQHLAVRRRLLDARGGGDRADPPLAQAYPQDPVPAGADVAEARVR